MDAQEVKKEKIKCLFIGSLANHAVIGRVAALVASDCDVYLIDAGDHPWIYGEYPIKNAKRIGQWKDPFFLEDSNIKKYFEHLFELDRVSVHFEYGEVRQYNDIFIQSGKYVFSYYKKDERIEVPARYSFVCKKEKTGWYIVEHHSSVFPN